MIWYFFFPTLFLNPLSQKETETEEALIKQGVRQGCGFSHILFNIYIETAINEIKERYAQRNKKTRSQHFDNMIF